MKSSKKLEAVLFDVFGTVVDWRSAVVAEGVALADAYSLDVDWPSFADRWRREGYLDPIGRMVRREEPWAPIDTVLRDHLGRLAIEHGFAGVPSDALDELSLVWERLEPWPDVLCGLDRLRRHYTVGTLSNGTFAGLTRMARQAGLHWDCIIASELFGTYKTDPRVYREAATLLDTAPERIMLVAAHPSDLLAASRCGFQTAYVARPLEWGEQVMSADPVDADVVVGDFVALAKALGA